MIRDMNFFAPYQGKKKEQKNKNIYIYSLVAFLFVVIIGSLAWNSINIYLVNNKIKSYKSKLEAKDVKEKIAKWDDVVQKSGILKKYNTELEKITGAVETRDIVNVDLLDKLSATLPSAITFQNINITNSEVTIQAKSINRTAIGELQHNLKQLDNIQDVYIGSISEGDGYTFDIKCVLKDVENNENK